MDPKASLSAEQGTGIGLGSRGLCGAFYSSCAYRQCHHVLGILTNGDEHKLISFGALLLRLRFWLRGGGVSPFAFRCSRGFAVSSLQSHLSLFLELSLKKPTLLIWFTVSNSVHSLGAHAITQPIVRTVEDSGWVGGGEAVLPGIVLLCVP